jgi:hypothetical protein
MNGGAGRPPAGGPQAWKSGKAWAGAEVPPASEDGRHATQRAVGGGRGVSR